MSKLFTSRLDVISRLSSEHGQKLTPLSWWESALRALDDKSTREIVLWLKRQAGKSTFLGTAAATSTILTKRNSYVVLVSASEKQAKAIYNRKIRRPMERLMRSLKLDDLASFTQNGIEIPALNSALEVVTPNVDTSPARTITELYLDECRSIPDEVFITLAPSVIGAGGKIILASTAGRPAGFFYEICTHPTPETLLIHTQENENPHASRRVLDYLKARLGLLSPAAMQREIENEFADDGQEFLSASLIDQRIDDHLSELAGSDAEAFAFGDLSRKRDLTSIVVVVRQRARRPEARDHLTVASVRCWNPKQSPTGEVDFAEVRAHLAELPRRFPRLRRVLIDGGAEGGSIFPFCRTHPKLTLIVQEFVATQDSNRELWGSLKARVEAGTLSIPRHERLIQELKSLRQESMALGLSWRIVDSSRKLHRDVSLSLAGACYAAGDLAEPFLFHSGGRTIGTAPSLVARLGETVEAVIAAVTPAEPRRRKSFEEMTHLMRGDLTDEEQQRFDAEVARRAKHRPQSELEQRIRAGGIYWPNDGMNTASHGDLSGMLEEVRQRFAMWR